MKLFALVFSLLPVLFCQAQHTLRVSVKTEEAQEPLPGASVIIMPFNRGASTDSLGLAVFPDLPGGPAEIEVSFVGYTKARRKIVLPYKEGVVAFVLEKNEDESNPDIVVTATRTDRSIRNTPTRVEVIAGGEITENISMRPGEIRMLLNETTGVNTQQISAISNTANIRIQQLDGRYTQVLRDGFPLYSGLSEGLSLVQVAPLDLKQVELIKGSSSTLYGGGAIAGLINLVSKTPQDKKELSFLANGTSAGGLDLSGFYAQRFGRIGLTLFGSRNTGSAYDPAGIGFTAIPRFTRYTFTPRFFVYGKRTTIDAGISYITEDRLGGSMDYVKHGTAGYFEENPSRRFTTQFGLTRVLGEHISLHLKNSYSHFRRTITIPSYQFEGLQQSSFSEISLNAGSGKSQWVTGLNLYTDRFAETVHSSHPSRSYDHTTGGAFVQHTWSPGPRISFESGLRADYTRPYAVAVLPRLSVLYRFTENFSSRLGGGLGYKLPSIFTEESEERQFRDILPLNNTITGYERSAGANMDFTYTAHINELGVFLNTLFFYTRINHPLVLQDAGSGQQQFVNANGYTDAKGIDMTLRLSLDELKFFTGYSYTVVESRFNGQSYIYPLSPKHKLHFDLVYEMAGRLRVALESYYTSMQHLSDGSTGRAYWILGALVEKSWKHFSLFVNSEDLNDARQTRWDTIFTGTPANPVFRDIYAPLEGITVNGGIKIRL